MLASWGRYENRQNQHRMIASWGPMDQACSACQLELFGCRKGQTVTVPQLNQCSGPPEKRSVPISVLL